MLACCHPHFVSINFTKWILAKSCLCSRPWFRRLGFMREQSQIPKQSSHITVWGNKQDPCWVNILQFKTKVLLEREKQKHHRRSRTARSERCGSAWVRHRARSALERPGVWSLVPQPTNHKMLDTRVTMINRKWVERSEGRGGWSRRAQGRTLQFCRQRSSPRKEFPGAEECKGQGGAQQTGEWKGSLRS